MDGTYYSKGALWAPFCIQVLARTPISNTNIAKLPVPVEPAAARDIMLLEGWCLIHDAIDWAQVFYLSKYRADEPITLLECLSGAELVALDTQDTMLECWKKSIL